MDKIISELRRLFALKNSAHGNRSELISRQLTCLKDLQAEEQVTGKIVQWLLLRIKELELHKEYNISAEDYHQLLQEKYVEENLGHLFVHEITTMKTDINNLRETLLSQEKTLAVDPLLRPENESYSRIERGLQKLMDEKARIKAYFEDLNHLKYNVKTIRRAQVVVKVINRIMFKIYVEGVENIPRHGPCIVTPRHYHALFDSLILHTLVERPIFWITAVEVFIPAIPLKNPIRVGIPYWSSTLMQLGSMPLKRGESQFGERKWPVKQEWVREYGSSNIRTFKNALIHLKYGDAIGIMIEGDAKIGGDFIRNTNEEFRTPTLGFVEIALLAKRKYNLDIPIIPIGIQYTTPNCRTASIKIGKSIYLDPNLQNLDAEHESIKIREYASYVLGQIKLLSS